MADVNPVTQTPSATPGTAGLNTQLPGQATTVSGLSAPDGGIAAGNMFESDLDADLFKFEGDDTPLVQLVLLSKHIPVKAPVVDHPLLDEDKTSVVTASAVSQSSSNQAILPLESADQMLCRVKATLRVRGVNGYTENGQTETPGVDLMLYVVGRDATTNNPLVWPVNGPKANATDNYCTIPAIPAGTTIDILSTALSETDKIVPPSSSKPVFDKVYLQKRGMNRIVSDYFESQKKRVPFTDALLAERDIRRFKQECERSYWVGSKGKFPVHDDKTGYEDVYFSQGIRWLFRREIVAPDKWTYEAFIGMAKMFYNSKVDVPKGAICLAGDNFMEGIQLIDFSKHPEVKIEVKHDKTLGWDLTHIHTLFGDFDFKRCSSLTRLGYANSCAIIGKGRLVDYIRSSEHSETERVEEHEATRESVIRWDGPALKGTCSMFVNGEGTTPAENAQPITLWNSTTAPSTSELVDGMAYYMLVNCTLKGKESLPKATITEQTTGSAIVGTVYAKVESSTAGAVKCAKADGTVLYLNGTKATGNAVADTEYYEKDTTNLVTIDSGANVNAKLGQIWKYSVNSTTHVGAFEEFKDEINVS